MTSAAPIDSIRVAAYTVPTDAPEADGTAQWTDTTLVLVEAGAGGAVGLGFSYAERAAATLVLDRLSDAVRGLDAFDVPRAHARMAYVLRNAGRPGLGARAIAAVDCALWDLKARLLGVPLARLLGCRRDAVPVYGSGGFTSYSVQRLQEQLAGWVEQDIPRVKMKIGASPADDPARVRAAREAIGHGAELFVDANGALDARRAWALALRFEESAVSWFEEPVSSDDLAGLRFVREHAPAGMEIAAGEYGDVPCYFRRMIEAGAVDVLQADVTRCEGISGFLAVAAQCDAAGMPLSGHTAPSMHLPVALAAPRVRHLEYFHDHVRIERMLFDGVAVPEGGLLRPDWSRPGNGLDFKRKDAERFAV